MGQRGSVVLLVIVALVIMVLLGAVYLQQARVQRFATGKTEGDIDAVTQAVIAQIQGELTDDLVQKDKLEMYDYPWTNPDTGPQDNRRKVTPLYGNPQTAYGGLRDDVWLASSQPDFTGTPSGNNAWRHITDLNGYFLGWNNSTSKFAMNNGHPRQDIVTFGGNGNRTTGGQPNNTDSFIDLNSQQLVDADGDGIPDSRWTWATIPQITGFSYTMAVRIVDLSGKVNANVALSQIAANGQYDASAAGADAPRWDTPAELNLGGFVYGLGGSANMNELANLLGYRYNANSPAPLPIPYTGTSSRRGFWNQQGRFSISRTNAGAGYNLYGVKNAYELLYKNGLNNQTADARIEGPPATPNEGMPNFLRRDGTGSSYNDVDLSQSGGSNGGNSRQNYFNFEPRHQMTTLSGAAVFAPPLPGQGLIPQNDSAYKVDLRDIALNNNRTKQTQAMRRVARRLRKVYTAGVNPPLNGVNQAPTNVPNQFAVNLADYADKDSNLTQFQANGKSYYGLEALPFLGEVYAQAQYQAKATKNGDAYDVTWSQTTPPGYAIEIRNPFRKAADLTTVHLYVGVKGNVTDWGKLSDLAGQNALGPMEVLLLRGNSAGGTGGTPDDPSQLYDTSTTTASGYSNPNTYTYTQKNITTQMANANHTWPATSGDTPEAVRVELRPTVESASANNNNGGGNNGGGNANNAGQVPDWPYDEVTAHSFPQSYDDTGVFATGGATNSEGKNPDGQAFYWQSGRLGDGRGLNLIAIADANYKQVEMPPKAQTVGQGYDGNEDDWKLALPDKGNAQYKNVLAKQQIVLSDRGRLFQVGELAHVVRIGPRPDESNPAQSKTVRAAWDDAEVYKNPAYTSSNNPGGQANDVRAFMLNFDPATALKVDDSGSNPNYNVPYAQFLLDQFTTLSPRDDNQDNNGDNRTDDDSENIVPGLVNLNTAPPELLNKILPIADASLRQEMIQFIMAYRRNDSTSPDPSVISNTRWNDIRRRVNPGLAYGGELYSLLRPLLTRGPGMGDDPTLMDTNGGGKVKIDFLSNPDNTTPDGVADDREEADAVARWLSQVGSTRSDYFAAYILVHGYQGSQSAAFNNADESKWVVVIFKRNAVSGQIAVKTVIPVSGLYEMK